LHPSAREVLPLLGGRGDQPALRADSSTLPAHLSHHGGDLSLRKTLSHDGILAATHLTMASALCRILLIPEVFFAHAKR